MICAEELRQPDEQVDQAHSVMAGQREEAEWQVEADGNNVVLRIAGSDKGSLVARLEGRRTVDQLELRWAVVRLVAMLVQELHRWA